MRNTLKSSEYNENIDLSTTKNLATVPITFMNQLVLGAYQVTGNFKVRNGEVDKYLNDAFLYFADILGYSMAYRAINDPQPPSCIFGRESQLQGKIMGIIRNFLG